MKCIIKIKSVFILLQSLTLEADKNLNSRDFHENINDAFFVHTLSALT